MREVSLPARQRRRFKQTTNSNDAFPIADNAFDRQFTVGGSNLLGGGKRRVLAGEGWLHAVAILAAILALSSRSHGPGTNTPGGSNPPRRVHQQCVGPCGAHWVSPHGRTNSSWRLSPVSSQPCTGLRMSDT